MQTDIDKAALAREVVSVPKGTTVLSSAETAGKSSLSSSGGSSSSPFLALPSAAAIRSLALRSVSTDFRRAEKMREQQRKGLSKPFRLTDVPIERFANAVRAVDPNRPETNQDKRVRQQQAASAVEGSTSTVQSVDESYLTSNERLRKAVAFEDTNYIGVANLQIYSFFGLTAAAGLGAVLIIGSIPAFPHISFALPFALASGWQSYSYYLSTWAACQQATKIQLLRSVQGGVVSSAAAQQAAATKKLQQQQQQQQQQPGEEQNGRDDQQEQQGRVESAAGEHRTKAAEQLMAIDAPPGVASAAAESKSGSSERQFAQLLGNVKSST